MFNKLKAAVLALFAITAFASDTNGKPTLTEEQRKKLADTFGEAFASKFVENLAKEASGQPIDNATSEAMVADLQDQLKKSSLAQVTLAEENKMLKDKADAQAAEKARIATELSQANATVSSQKEAIEALSKKPEPEPNGKAGSVATDHNGWTPTGKDTHLFGENHSFLAIDSSRPYNMRAYAAMAARYGIQVSGVREAESLDYSQLKSDLGDYYRIRKQDRIQSFLQELPSLTKIFNLESGYQDQAVLVNLFLTDEFSQADSTSLGSSFDSMVKGGYKFEPEVITMYDVMFVHKFSAMKELEKGWIGYLNREGSSTMKWSFIEYILVETAKKLKNEQEIRRIRGIRKNPTVNVSGTSLGAANGLLKFIKNQIAAFKVKAFSMGEWNSGNIANHIYTGTQMVPEVLRDSGRIILYMSTDALSMYHKNLETLYGMNQDYAANIQYVKEYPSVKIVAIPGMAPSKRMVWTLENNFALFEDKPGEMLNFQLEQQDWTLKVWSNWRESFWAYLTGKKYASAAEMPSDYSTQLIFCNDVDEPADYYVAMEKDDTTPSVANHSSLVSVANTESKAITGIDDCAVEQEVRLKRGVGTYGITIAASGNFSLITAAWNPAVGDTIILKKRADGKFIELNRTTATSDATAFAADDATPSVAGNSVFITDANTQATAITTLDNAATGVVYTIHGAGSTNASTIANSGNFVLTAAMTLSAGAYIKLQKSSVNGKFYEISRSA